MGWLLTALLFLQAEAADALPCQQVSDGPAEGMCFERTMSAKGINMTGLKPSTGKGRSMPRDLVETVERLMADHDRGELMISRELLAAEPVSYFCLTWSSRCLTPSTLTHWQLGSEFTHSAPFLLKDGRIRIEWFMDGRFSFWSFIEFEGRKIKRIMTSPPVIPVAP